MMNSGTDGAALTAILSGIVSGGKKKSRPGFRAGSEAFYTKSSASSRGRT